MAAELAYLAWWILGVGLVSHLLGMLGVRQLLTRTGYKPPAWQQAAYWLCWAAIGAIIIYSTVQIIA